MSFNYDIVELVTENEAGLVGKHPSWERVRLGDIANIQNGAAFDSSFFNQSDGMSLIRIRDIVAGKTETRYNGPALESPVAAKGDVLVGMDGDFNCRIWNGEKALVNQRVCKIVVNERLYNKIFMYHAIHGYLKLINKNTSSVTVKHLSSKTISDIPLPLPPANEQTRIVSKIEELFSELDKGEESLLRAQALLKKYRQSVLKAAVTGELTREWRGKNKDRLERGEALLKRILKARREAWEKSELAKLRAKNVKPEGSTWKKKYKEHFGPINDGIGGIPCSWIKIRIDMAGDVQLGRQRAPKHHAGIYMRPYLRVANVFEERIDLSDVMEMNFTPDEFVEYCLLPSDILLNEGQSADLVGRPALYDGQLPGCCFTNTLVRFRAYKDVVVPKYALIVFIYLYHLGKFRKISKITTNIAHLGGGRFAELAMPVPPIEEQMLIVDEFERVRQTIEVAAKDLDNQLNLSKSLRQAIFKVAFTGKLVPQNPNDEPASELLKRIAAQKAAQADSRPRRATGPRKKTTQPKSLATAAEPAAPLAPVPAAPKKSVQTLAQLRKTAGMSQAALAKSVGLNQAYISQMETGKRAITEEQRQALAKALGVGPNALR